MAKRKLFLLRKANYVINESTLEEAMLFIEASLREIGLKPRSVMKTLLSVEEIIALLLEQAEPGTVLRTNVRSFFGDITVVLSVRGNEVDLFDEKADYKTVSSLEGSDLQRAIRGILLKAEGGRIRFSYRAGINKVRIAAHDESRSLTLAMIYALLAGVVFAYFLNVLFPPEVSRDICSYVLEPANDMFMRGLQSMLSPLIFFSMVAQIAQFKNLSELGRLGARVMAVYLFTTVISVLVSIMLSQMFHPGKLGFALLPSDTAAGTLVSSGMDTSVRMILTGIIPDNFITPFIEVHTLQIMFLGVMCGCAVNAIGEYTTMLKDFFEACNSLCVTVTSFITRFVPAAEFCAVVLMIHTQGRESFAAVLGMLGLIIAAIMAMFAVYGLLILLAGRLNPIPFFRKMRRGMAVSLVSASSSAAIPVNMAICTEKLGISEKVAGFSIPLGAMVNMDGGCILMAVAGLFLARAYGIVVPPSALLSLSLTIVLLSLGSPCIPGVGIVWLGAVLETIGVPMHALSLVIGLYPFLDTFITVSNTTGDVAAALVVARNEGLLDLDVYRS